MVPLYAVSLLALTSAAPRTPAHAALHQQCLLYAAQPQNPWALAHGVTAFGRHFAASDGRKAADVVMADFLRDGGPAEGNPYSFERYAKDGTPIEPHTNLITKTLVLAGVPGATTFKARFGKVSMRALVAGVERGFRHVPQSEEYWRDVGWTLDLLGASRKPGKAATFQPGGGEAVDFDGVMDDALAYLERSQADLLAGMSQGLPQVAKRKQGIYAHACGGLHLVQPVLVWSRHPAVKKRWGERLNKQVDVLFYRLGSEARQYQAALAQAPEYRLQILVQMVKFFGHFLETTGRLKDETSWRPSKAQRADIERAKAFLTEAVLQLQKVNAFASMESLKTSSPQVYLDLIGDSCHATHGWDYWR